MFVIAIIVIMANVIIITTMGIMFALVDMIIMGIMTTIIAMVAMTMMTILAVKTTHASAHICVGMVIMLIVAIIVSRTATAKRNAARTPQNKGPLTLTTNLGPPQDSGESHVPSSVGPSKRRKTARALSRWIVVLLVGTMATAPSCTRSPSRAATALVMTAHTCLAVKPQTAAMRLHHKRHEGQPGGLKSRGNVQVAVLELVVARAQRGRGPPKAVRGAPAPLANVFGRNCWAESSLTTIWFRSVAAQIKRDPAASTRPPLGRAGTKSLRTARLGPKTSRHTRA